MIQQFWKEERKIQKLFLIDFILYCCTFLLVPIIPLYMKNLLYFDSSQIGFIIGIPSIICCFFSGVSYLCFKKLGSFYSILISIFIDISVCIVFIFQGEFYLILGVYIFKGISGSIFMPIFKNLYINTLVNKENKDIVFKIRYLLICTSAIFSPLISNYLYPFSEKIVFLIVIFLNFIAINIIFFFKNTIISIEINKKTGKIKDFIYSKKNFLIFLIACIGILAVFSQFEGTFILTIKENALDIFSKLLILNSILGILLQLFNMKFLKKISSYNSIILGCLFFSVAYFCFFILNKSFFYFIFSIFLFTLGETLVLPNIEIFATEISNEEDRIILYSFLEFKRLGFFLGPFISGLLIKNFSNSFMYLSFSALSLFSCFIFIFFKKNLKKNI